MHYQAAVLLTNNVDMCILWQYLCGCVFSFLLHIYLAVNLLSCMTCLCLRNGKIVFWSGWSSEHSYQQYVRISAFPHPHWHWLSVFMLSPYQVGEVVFWGFSSHKKYTLQKIRCWLSTRVEWGSCGTILYSWTATSGQCKDSGLCKTWWWNAVRMKQSSIF